MKIEVNLFKLCSKLMIIELRVFIDGFRLIAVHCIGLNVKFCKRLEISTRSDNI